MIEFFKWVDSLPVEMAWLLLASISFAMALAPFVGTLWKAFSVLFRNEKAEIHDFSWRFIPNWKMGGTDKGTLHVLPSERPVVYEGMVIMLSWHVRGAFRTDVLPLKKRMKGNVAFVPVHAGRNVYALEAHTWKGKIRKELVIEASTVRKLHTFNLSKEAFFGQPSHDLKSAPLSNQLFAGKSYVRLPLTILRTISMRRLPLAARPLKSIFTASKYHQPVSNHERREMMKRANNSGLVRTIAFNPRPYNRAILEFKQQQFIEPHTRSNE